MSIVLQVRSREKVLPGLAGSAARVSSDAVFVQGHADGGVHADVF